MTTPTLTFQLCDQHYALPIEHIIEVAAMVETAQIQDENASPALYGVVIRRGEPVMLIDLRRVMGCDDAPIMLDTLFIVVRYGKELVGFIVDHVQGVVYFQEERLREVSRETGYVRGVITHDQVVVQWLNLPAILQSTLPDKDG
jgi:chemotaxis signal transduction protein